MSRSNYTQISPKFNNFRVHCNAYSYQVISVSGDRVTYIFFKFFCANTQTRRRTKRTQVLHEIVQIQMPYISQTAFFSLRIVNEWNKLPQTVIEVTSVNSFKNRLDRHWSDMGVYTADTAHQQQVQVSKYRPKTMPASVTIAGALITGHN